MGCRTTTLLEHDINALRLPTFHREYEKMAAQCTDEKVDPSRLPS